MKTVRVVVLALLVASFVVARPRPAAAADTVKAMLIGGLIGAGVGAIVVLVMRLARDEPSRSAIGPTSQPPPGRTAFELAPSPCQEAAPMGKGRAEWASGTILTF